MIVFFELKYRGAKVKIILRLFFSPLYKSIFPFFVREGLLTDVYCVNILKSVLYQHSSG